MVIFVLVFYLSRQGFMFMAFRCWLSPSVLTFAGGTTLCNSPHLSDNTENSLSWVCVFNFELLFLVWVDLSSMCEDGVFSSDWWMRWPPPKSDPWGSPLLALPLLYLHLPPFAAPCPARSYLTAVKDFDRTGNLTLGVGQRWRREQEHSGGRPSLRKTCNLLCNPLCCWHDNVLNGSYRW